MNATATYNSTNVPGTFTYTPASGTVLNAGPAQNAFRHLHAHGYEQLPARQHERSNQRAEAPLTITANNTNKVYGAAVPAFTASYSGFVNGDTASSLTTPVH